MAMSSDQSVCDHAPLLCSATEGLSGLGNTCNLLGSAHLRSKWKLIGSAHFVRMALLYAGRDGHNWTLTHQTKKPHCYGLRNYKVAFSPSVLSHDRNDSIHRSSEVAVRVLN